MSPYYSESFEVKAHITNHTSISMPIFFQFHDTFFTGLFPNTHPPLKSMMDEELILTVGNICLATLVAVWIFVFLCWYDSPFGPCVTQSASAMIFMCVSRKAFNYEMLWFLCQMHVGQGVCVSVFTGMDACLIRLRSCCCCCCFFFYIVNTFHFNCKLIASSLARKQQHKKNPNENNTNYKNSNKFNMTTDWFNSNVGRDNKKKNRMNGPANDFEQKLSTGQRTTDHTFIKYFF